MRFMKNFISVISAIVLSAVLGAAIFINETNLSVERKITASNESAPRECLKIFEEFFQYVYKGKSDIVKDMKAQDKWLSKNLKNAFTKHIEASGKPEENPDYPSNASFVGAWEYPAGYSVIGSRKYGNRAIIDVNYKWGKGQNYEGDERQMSFIFVFEEKSWKLDDVYTFKSEYSSEESLAYYFKNSRTLKINY